MHMKHQKGEEKLVVAHPKERKEEKLFKEFGGREKGNDRTLGSLRDGCLTRRLVMIWGKTE